MFSAEKKTKNPNESLDFKSPANDNIKEGGPLLSADAKKGIESGNFSFVSKKNEESLDTAKFNFSRTENRLDGRSNMLAEKAASLKSEELKGLGDMKLEAPAQELTYKAPENETKMGLGDMTAENYETNLKMKSPKAENVAELKAENDKTFGESRNKILAAMTDGKMAKKGMGAEIWKRLGQGFKMGKEALKFAGRKAMEGGKNLLKFLNRKMAEKRLNSITKHMTRGFENDTDAIKYHQEQSRLHAEAAERLKAERRARILKNGALRRQARQLLKGMNA